jgi:hypothetical protein
VTGGGDKSRSDDVILFSLGLGVGQCIFANVYSDTQHTAVRILHEDLVALPRLHLMCGDFNIRHASWDPNGPEVCVHADHLMAVCDALGLTLPRLSRRGLPTSPIMRT